MFSLNLIKGALKVTFRFSYSSSYRIALSFCGFLFFAVSVFAQSPVDMIYKARKSQLPIEQRGVYQVEIVLEEGDIKRFSPVVLVSPFYPAVLQSENASGVFFPKQILYNKEGQIVYENDPLQDGFLQYALFSLETDSTLFQTPLILYTTDQAQNIRVFISSQQTKFEENLEQSFIRVCLKGYFNGTLVKTETRKIPYENILPEENDYFIVGEE